MFYVYVYYEPVTMKPFYVGKGKNNRSTDHLLPFNMDNGTPLSIKLMEIFSSGEIPIINRFRENLTEQEAFSLERLLISHWGRVDTRTGILLNRTDGGEGFSTQHSRLGVGQSTETKIKISQAQANRSEETERKNRESVLAHRGRPVVQVNLLTGKVLRIYDSLRATKNHGFNPTSVRLAIDGPLRSTGGYKWRDAIQEDYNQETVVCQ